MTYQNLEILENKTDNFVVINLNRPQSLNAINLPLAEELHNVLKIYSKDNRFRCLVLAGKGNLFCAGGDVKLFKKIAEENKTLDKFDILPDILHQIIITMRCAPKPVLTVINGGAFGAGLSLVLASDIKITHTSAKFGTAYLKLGLAPDGGATYFLPKVLGLAKSLELILLSEIISSEQAKEFNLVNKIFADEIFLPESINLAKRLAQLPTIAVAKTKELLLASFNNDLKTQLDLEKEIITTTAYSDDFKEGVMAFAEKREPLFKGK